MLDEKVDYDEDACHHMIALEEELLSSDSYDNRIKARTEAEDPNLSENNSNNNDNHSSSDISLEMMNPSTNQGRNQDKIQEYLWNLDLI